MTESIRLLYIVQEISIRMVKKQHRGEAETVPSRVSSPPPLSQGPGAFSAGQVIRFPSPLAHCANYVNYPEVQGWAARRLPLAARPSEATSQSVFTPTCLCTGAVRVDSPCPTRCPQIQTGMKRGLMRWTDRDEDTDKRDETGEW